MSVLRKTNLRLLSLTTALISTASLSAYADNAYQGFVPSYNTFGATGLIDMPSGEMQADGAIGAGLSHFAAVSRGLFTFQMLERLELTHRLSRIGNWTDADQKFLSKEFDLKLQLLQETNMLPSVSVGMQDLFAHGANSAQYIAATKNIGNTIKVTAGAGWGRLSNSDTVQVHSDPDMAGTPLFDEWFSGPVGYFGGIEWATPIQGLTAKVEYSSDTYFSENEITGTRTSETFERRSPINYGLNYTTKGGVTYGLQYKYGSQVGFQISTNFGPSRPRARVDSKVRPIHRRGPQIDYSTDWLNIPGIQELAVKQLKAELGANRLGFEAVRFDGQTVDLWIKNFNYAAPSQAFGRAARALAKIFPDSVETFKITTVNASMPTATLIINRSDLERYEFEPNASALMARSVEIVDAPATYDGMIYEDGGYPKFSWSILPSVSISLFDNQQELSAKLKLAANADYQFSRNFKVSSSVQANVYDTATQTADDPYLDHLEATYTTKLRPDTYARVSAGYLSKDHAGIAAEVLWKPADKKYGFGTSLAVGKERNSDWFELSGDDFVSGFVSGYLDLSKGFRAGLHLGRYAEGDWGGTFEFDRTFGNGFKIGAYTTITDVQGSPTTSIKQGVSFTIPLSFATGVPGGGNIGRSFTASVEGQPGDAGKRVNGTTGLIDIADRYHIAQTEASWGAFWK